MINNYKEKLNRLTESSVWVFTKQSISFDTAYKAVKLLAEIPNRETVNVESYFAENHEKYGIDTDRHRVLVISQLFGLLTKTPLYEKGGRYNTEQTTEVFELLNKYPIGSKEYNTLKTEQILKIKIKAIIDTVDNNKNWNILPAIFSYKVLKTLKEQHGVTDISLEHFYTYIMTCSDYSDVDETVQFLAEKSPVSEYVNKYKSKSRFMTLFQNNFNLFNISSDSISINEIYDDYFNEMFMERFDIDELNMQLSRDVDYTYFLTTHQNFGINLLDKPTTDTILKVKLSAKEIKNKKVAILDDDAIEDDDIDYINKVNNIKSSNINPEIGENADKVEPIITVGSIAKRYSKNPIIGKIAIQNANYKCENIEDHKTFTSNTTNMPFMEAHHLIPIRYQKEIWDRFRVNVDCIQNIVSLCPNCHRAIHYAVASEEIEIIKKSYMKKTEGLKKIGIDLSLDEILSFYIKL